MPSTIAVYCGSSAGRDRRYAEVAHTVGTAIAGGGHRLVYGGGSVGLMGVVADAALAAGGQVVGVITEHLKGSEVAHDGLTHLDVVPSMHERKARMTALADGVIVLPGGYGTLDEAFETLTWNQLGLTATPVVFYDVGGYFGPLFEFVEGAVAAGFMKDQHLAAAQRASTAEEALRLATAPPPEFTPKWLR